MGGIIIFCSCAVVLRKCGLLIPTYAYLDVLRTFIIGIFPGGSQCGVHDK